MIGAGNRFPGASGRSGRETHERQDPNHAFARVGGTLAPTAASEPSWSFAVLGRIDTVQLSQPTEPCRSFRTGLNYVTIGGA